jgi:hypothetical protein
MTDTITSVQRFGRCINNGYCSLANKRTPILLTPGDPLDCPECGKPIIVIPPAGKKLVQTGTKVKAPPKILLILGLVIASLVAVGLYYNLFRPLPESLYEQDDD